MRVATGKVIGGKVVVDGAPLTEGATVTVLARDEGESFDVSPEQESALLAAIAEAEGGETIPGGQLLESLRRSV